MDGEDLLVRGGDGVGEHGREFEGGGASDAGTEEDGALECAGDEGEVGEDEGGGARVEHVGEGVEDDEARFELANLCADEGEVLGQGEGTVTPSRLL